MDDEREQSIFPGSVTTRGDDRSGERRAEPAARPRDGGPAGADRRGGIVPLLGALALGILIGAFAMSLLGRGDAAGLPDRVDSDRFQAVILSNDKVYFGKVSEAGDDFYALDDAFFLRETRASEDAEPVRSLLPINRELHAPENRMLIRRDEVVLIENLDADSPIQKEIDRQLGDGDE